MLRSFGRLFLAVDALFIALAAGLAASATNRFVGVALEAVPAASATAAIAGSVPQLAPSAAAAGDPAVRDFDDATSRNIFGAQREALAGTNRGAAGSGGDTPAGDPQPTSLRARLVATSVFDPASWSLATIVDLASQTSALYSINACAAADPLAPCNNLLGQARVVAIDVDRVVLVNRTSGRREVLVLGAEPLAASASIATAAPAATVGAAAGIKQTSATSYEVAGNALDSALADLPATSPPRLSPQIEGGQTTGFKLFSIRPDSLYSKIGLQNGDILKRVNGYAISNTNDALELVGRLKQTDQVTIDLVRRGQPTSIEYRIVR